MVSERKIKGDIAVAKVISDLTEKDYVIFTPVLCEHLPFDLIAYKDGYSFRIQCKSSANGFVSNKNIWSDKNGYHTKVYSKDDFDYYAIYIAPHNKICYPSINFGGITINAEIPNCYNQFYWYEDFLNFTDSANKRKNSEVKHAITEEVIKSRIAREVIAWPNPEEFQKLLWAKPMVQLSKELGVSDKAISKRAKRLGLTKPPIGHWSK